MSAAGFDFVEGQELRFSTTVTGEATCVTVEDPDGVIMKLRFPNLDMLGQFVDGLLNEQSAVVSELSVAPADRVAFR